MAVHRAGIAQIFVSPQAFQQIVPGKYLAGVRRERPQNFQFLFRKRHGLPPDLRLIIIQAYGQVADHSPLAGFVAVNPPQRGAQTGHHLSG